MITSRLSQSRSLITLLFPELQSAFSFAFAAENRKKSSDCDLRSRKILTFLAAII